ncbi:copper(I)-binding protein [Pseudonocardia kunmingensis]|uniref:Copper(I)-binding protein n=1 Tax=Pseudonocardia kunmingensis TaxID=630975 RepID=A0A543E2J6_9PSEU|nr:copper(I)-binding protein [Pseudonocardia kunmingensis]
MPGDRKDVTLVSDRARRRPTRAALAAGTLIGALALAGCGAGQITQTSDQVAAVEGANATAGQIAVRNATFEFDGPVEGDAVHAVGADAPLSMTIVNTGAELDRLVSASSPVATTVQITGDMRVSGGQALAVRGAPAAPAPAPADAAAAPGEEATPGEEPATGTTPEAAAVAPLPIDEGTPGVANIVLSGLREDIQAGRTYPLVLTFERAGELRFEVPVANPDTLRESGHA